MTIFGHFDIAQLCLYAFWAFFIGLVIYLQRETMREGYPMESEVSGKPAMFGPWSIPSPKVFNLPHGHGRVLAPNPEKDAREITDRKLPMRATEKWSGSPFEPTGDPMVDGVGPAAWAERADHPELTIEGAPKVVPMASAKDWAFSAGERDIRGWKVTGCDGKVAGTLKDVWVDRSESVIRYIEVDLEGGKTALCPMNAVRIDITDKTAKVASVTAAQFAKAPKNRKAGQITMLEEEKVMAFYAGGRLYATPDRAEPWL